jgi:hypothetical protein
MTTESSSALEEIEQLQARIAQLKLGAVTELRNKIAATRRALADQEAELAKLTGRPAGDLPVAKRTRRPSITDDQLKPQILAIMATDGKNGMNAKEIAGKLGQDVNRLRKFLKENPKAMKRQGSGPGTKFFLQ